MSRTKEIDVWLKSYYEDGDEDFTDMILSDNELTEDYKHIVKAKLIIELPERKKLITESELVNAMSPEISRITINRIVSRLFGEDS